MDENVCTLFWKSNVFFSKFHHSIMWKDIINLKFNQLKKKKRLIIFRDMFVLCSLLRFLEF